MLHPDNPGTPSCPTSLVVIISPQLDYQRSRARGCKFCSLKDDRVSKHLILILKATFPETCLGQSREGVRYNYPLPESLSVGLLVCHPEA